MRALAAGALASAEALTPDWQATLGIEYRASGQLFDAQPYARFDLAYVGESVNSLFQSGSGWSRS